MGLQQVVAWGSAACFACFACFAFFACFACFAPCFDLLRYLRGEPLAARAKEKVSKFQLSTSVRWGARQAGTTISWEVDILR